MPHGNTGILVDLPELWVRSDDSLLRCLWGGKKCCGRSNRGRQHSDWDEALVHWPYTRQLGHTRIAPGTPHCRLDSRHACWLLCAALSVPLDQRRLLCRSVGERRQYSELAAANPPLGGFDRLDHDTIVCATSATCCCVDRCLRANLQRARNGACQVACDRNGARICDSVECATARSARTLQEFANVCYALFRVCADLVVRAVSVARYYIGPYALHHTERRAGAMASFDRSRYVRHSSCGTWLVPLRRAQYSLRLVEAAAGTHGNRSSRSAIRNSQGVPCRGFRCHPVFDLSRSGALLPGTSHPGIERLL